MSQNAKYWPKMWELCIGVPLTEIWGTRPLYSLWIRIW